MNSDGPIAFASRSRVSVLNQVCFGIIILVIFGGSGIKRWWKSTKR
ncbi:hypothetical protein MtrunA17_Chr8g0370911 [Medicago truncatula]|uniref:Transmembrane protein n=1 Tax=Medicago truncatula TaxID=3880 RepID=A0A396GTF6_MEDTR|nr:hypothetical protein MtrunA17_Chr8g0370911 [Medicago truncatula]